MPPFVRTVLYSAVVLKHSGTETHFLHDNMSGTQQKCCPCDPRACCFPENVAIRWDVSRPFSNREVNWKERRRFTTMTPAKQPHSPPFFQHPIFSIWLPRVGVSRPTWNWFAAHWRALTHSLGTSVPPIAVGAREGKPPFSSLSLCQWRIGRWLPIDHQDVPVAWARLCPGKPSQRRTSEKLSCALTLFFAADLIEFASNKLLPWKIYPGPKSAL